MISITHQKSNEQLSKYVRKISRFCSDGKIKYKQKLTPSAFTYLSYNHLDIPDSIFNSQRIQPDKRMQIAGPKLDDDIYVEYDGQLCQILIEFTASGFYYLFHTSPSQFNNRLVDFDNSLSVKIENHLEQTIKKLNSPEELVSFLQEFLINISAEALPVIDYIENGLDIIEENNGNIGVKEICNQVGISERQFNRKFRQVVGIAPKCYLKINQLHYIIKLMHINKNSSMQDIAYEAEFYDPAHFTRRFKELTTFTPHEFINSDKHIALDFFSD